LTEFFDYLWYFIRGDTDVSEFEQWVYKTTELEERVDPETYLEIVSVDFSNTGDVFYSKKNFGHTSRKTKNMSVPALHWRISTTLVCSNMITPSNHLKIKKHMVILIGGLVCTRATNVIKTGWWRRKNG